MRICLISREFAPFFGAGIGTYAASWARALAAAGHEVHVVSRDHPGLRERGPTLFPGVTFHAVDPADGPPRLDHNYSYARHALAVLATVRRLHERRPFDVIEYNGEVLVADEGQDKIVRYTMEGKFNERFTSALDVPQLDFPQQMAIASNGNLLVCAFSTGVILEFDSGANLVGQYDPGTLELYRGIAELDNGNLLVTTTTGVFEVTRTGIVGDVEATTGDFRYITRIPVMGRAESFIPDTESLPMPAPDSRDRAEILRDERGES